MNQQNGMAWRLAVMACAAGMAFGTAWAGEDAATENTTTENTEATIRMLHEASMVTPIVQNFDQYASGEALAGPLAACFDSATPPAPDVMAAVQQYMYGGARYQLASRWSGPQGSPRALTWSFVPDGLNIPNGIGEGAATSRLFSRMDSQFASQGGRATWIGRFEQVFNRWAELSGLSYTRVTAPGVDWDDGASWGTAGGAQRGDVRISCKPIDGGSGVLAYNSFPSGGGDMVMDSGESWGSSSQQNRFMRNTVAHEHGHGLGFEHVCPINNTKLMEPFLSTSFDGPRQDEIRAVQRFYGDDNEDNNTPLTATDLGTIASVPSSTVYGTTPAPVAGSADPNSANFSIDANGEMDYYKVGVDGPLIAQFTVTPVGSSYVDAPQTSNCNQTSPIVDALRQANLALNVYQSDGLTELHQASAADPGMPEAVSNVLVSDSDGGNAFVYVRVYETDTPSQAQLYRLTINAVSRPTMSATDNTFTDKVQLSWTDVTGETGYEIYRDTTTTLPAAPIASVGPNVASYEDTTAVPGTVYQYWVKATFSAGSPRMVAGPEAGSAQFTEPPTCAADLNEDGIVDFSDYLEFLGRYDIGDLSIDFNQDGIVDFSDYLDFLTLFDAGC